MKRSNSSSQPPIDATIAQAAKKIKKGTTLVLPDDTWSHIRPYVESETLLILAFAGKTTRDAAVFRDVADGSFSLMPTTERHFVELVKKDGYNLFFQDLFASPLRSHDSPHLKCEALFAQLGDVGTLKGKVPTGVTSRLLRLLKYGGRAQLEALAKLCGKDEVFDDRVLLLEAGERMQKVLETAYGAG